MCIRDSSRTRTAFSRIKPHEESGNNGNFLPTDCENTLELEPHPLTDRRTDFTKQVSHQFCYLCSFIMESVFLEITYNL